MILLELTAVVKILHPKVSHIFHESLDLMVMLNCLIVLVIKTDDLTDKTSKRKHTVQKSWKALFQTVISIETGGC